jgi:hypothetical protein
VPIPEMVDTSSFEVSRNLAVTPGAVVLRTEVLGLIQYRPRGDAGREADRPKNAAQPGTAEPDDGVRRFPGRRPTPVAAALS